MKRFLIILGILCGTACASFAQTDTLAHMSIGINAGVPLGPVSSLYSSVTGLSVKFEFPFPGGRTYFTVGTGISDFNLKSTYSNDSTKQSGHFVPLLVGIKYYLYKRIYIAGDIGDTFNINANYLGYQSAFTYSPMAGVSIPVKQNTAAIDVSVNYESRLEQGGSINQLTLGVAYKFGL